MLTVAFKYAKLFGSLPQEYTSGVLVPLAAHHQHNVKRIADILCAKYLGAAAQELREMVRLDCRGLLPRPKLSLAERLFRAVGL